MVDLSHFWESLETNFPLRGTASDLRKRLGRHVSAALVAAGILTFVHLGTTVACPDPHGEGCPRQVIELSDGSLQAVCGNTPPACEPVALAREDIEVLAVDPEQLCQALRQPLRLGGRVAQMDEPGHTCWAGTVQTEPDVRHPVYFVARCTASAYAEAIEAIRTQHDGRPFAVLIPTDRFVAASTICRMGALGVPIIPLRGVVNIDRAGQMVASASVQNLFAGIGRRSVPAVSLHGGGWYSHILLAEVFGIPRETLRKRLDRYRETHQDGWMASEDHRSRDSQYLYQLDAVRSFVEEVGVPGRRPRVIHKPSVERPAADPPQSL